MPGVTKEQEVDSFLRNLSEVETNSIEISSTIRPNDSLKFSFIRKRDGFGRILFKEGIVVAMIFGPIDRAIRLNDVIKSLGEPEKVLAFYFKGERIQLTTFLLYPSKGIAIVNGQLPFRGEQAKIEPGQRVDALYYFDPKLFDELMTGGFISNHPLELIQTGMQPWRGFGEYSYIQTDW